MTTAWYTNIVKTSGLVFEAESWGFDGNIEVDETPVIAAPGDTGLVKMTVENTADSISAISLNVTKAGMQEEMQKRLFFYVDTHMIRNEETMDRVYLNNYEGYTYTLFGKGQLSLTGEASNAPQVKWHWVYDVLGYYVIAQPQEMTDQNGADTTNMYIKEYLRPIEYDYDKATTSLVTTGGRTTVKLETVDGTTSPDIYLWQISHRDGYPGTIDPEDGKNGFYPVEVDKNGYGVYAYLCNYSEIQMATDYDTMLGELAYKQDNGGDLSDEEELMLSHTATLIISAQKHESTAVNVNTLSHLKKAITGNVADVIQLSHDITIPQGETLTIPRNARVMLDLNEYAIISGSAATAIKAEPGSSLTMLNGSLQGPGDDSKTYGVYATGAEVVMSNVDVNGFRYGAYLGDNEGSNEIDSRLHMLGCTVNAKYYAVFASGNGMLSSQKTQVIIDDCTLSSDNIVITGNGDTSGNGRWGTDIQILNSQITANTYDNTVRAAGIYQPQQESSLLIYNSTVTGYNAVALKGGSARIVESKIEGTGIYQEPAFGGSGFTDTGDAVYIETNYGYEILLEISDSRLKHADPLSRSLRVYEDTATNVAVKIESGVFDEIQPDAYLVKGVTQTEQEDNFIVQPASEE